MPYQRSTRDRQAAGGRSNGKPERSGLRGSGSTQPGEEHDMNLDTTGHLGLIYADTMVFMVGAVLALAGLRGRRATR